MNRSRAMRYAVWSATVATLAGLVLLALTLSRGGPAVRWESLGWAMTAVPGVVGGTWMAGVHGRRGSGFVAALVTCILARLLASAAGAFAAAARGEEAIWPYVAGLVAGFLPVQVFEVSWFFQQGRRGLAPE